jgi:hypothetical protein
MKQQKFVLSAVAASLALAYGMPATASVTSPVIGALLWSEEFNGTALNTSLWTTYDGNGCQINLCGYGNQELEYYSPNNLSIVNVPFETATRALAIQARSQTVGSNVFTSGKIDSFNKVQVQYGMVEIRMAQPALGVGLWPAAWMLGVSPQAWPRKGEIDIMESGHKASSRAAAGSPTPSIDNFVGSNVITWQQAACVTGQRKLRRLDRVADQELVRAVAIVRQPLRDLPLLLDRIADALHRDRQRPRVRHVQQPAAGELDRAAGAVLPAVQPGGGRQLHRCGDAGAGDGAAAGHHVRRLRARVPARWQRLGQAGQPDPAEVGKFGVYTDNTAVNNKLEAGNTSDVFVWNNASTSAGTIAPYEARMRCRGASTRRARGLAAACRPSRRAT